MKLKNTIKMTAKERKTLIADRRYYEAQGFPRNVAHQRAWDHFYVSRNRINNKFKEMFV